MATEQEDINDASMRIYLEEERARIPQDILDDAKLFVQTMYPNITYDWNGIEAKMYIQGRLDERAKLSTERLSRVEVIGNGREYVNINTGKVELSFQDDNRTLKVFVEKGK